MYADHALNTDKLTICALRWKMLWEFCSLISWNMCISKNLDICRIAAILHFFPKPYLQLFYSWMSMALVSCIFLPWFLIYLLVSFILGFLQFSTEFVSHPLDLMIGGCFLGALQPLSPTAMCSLAVYNYSTRGGKKVVNSKLCRLCHHKPFKNFSVYVYLYPTQPAPASTSLQVNKNHHLLWILK